MTREHLNKLIEHCNAMIATCHASGLPGAEEAYRRHMQDLLEEQEELDKQVVENAVEM